MIRKQNNSGFTLIELMIVVAIIAIIASVAIPKLMSARLSANESAAISTLRSISSAQAQLQSSSAIDTDGDGGGEYGFFAELAGSFPVRVYDPVGDTVADGVATEDELTPSMLSSAFGSVEDDGTGDGVVSRSGYYFKMLLPDVTTAGATPAIAEDPAGGAGAYPDPNNGEVLWCCYAWPMDATKTGNRCFFINQEGDVLQYNNRDADYDGLDTIPPFDAVFSVADDMGSPLGVNGVASNDGFLWTVLQ